MPRVAARMRPSIELVLSAAGLRKAGWHFINIFKTAEAY